MTKTKNSLERYDLVTNYRCGSSIEEMELSDDGEWMRYEDHAAVIAGYEQRLSLIHWWSESARAAGAVDPVAGIVAPGPRATPEPVLSKAVAPAQEPHP